MGKVILAIPFLSGHPPLGRKPYLSLKWMAAARKFHLRPFHRCQALILNNHVNGMLTANMTG